MKIALRAGEMMNLKPFDLLRDRRMRRQQRRNCDQRPQVRGYAGGELQAGKGDAPKIRVTKRFTNATDTSIAGIAPSIPSRLSHAP